MNSTKNTADFWNKIDFPGFDPHHSETMPSDIQVVNPLESIETNKNSRLIKQDDGNSYNQQVYENTLMSGELEVNDSNMNYNSNMNQQAIV